MALHVRLKTEFMILMTPLILLVTAQSVSNGTNGTSGEVTVKQYKDGFTSILNLTTSATDTTAIDWENTSISTDNMTDTGETLCFLSSVCTPHRRPYTLTFSTYLLLHQNQVLLDQSDMLHY